MPRYIGKEMSRVDGVAKVTGRSGGRRIRPCGPGTGAQELGRQFFSQECARLSRIGRGGTYAMSYINSVSETVSPPHTDIEHKKIANLNRHSLTVQVAKVSDDQYRR